MSRFRAALFDFGGTLYDYRSFDRAEAEAREALARWADVEAEPDAIRRAHQDGFRDAFAEFVDKPYYSHREMFATGVRRMLERLGAPVDPAHIDRHRELQWQGHARDFVLRDGVLETLAELRARGLHVGMVSNIDDDQLEHLIEVAGLRPSFDSILSSESARSCKPHAAIFERALERAGCAAGEALFIGDSRSADVAGANASGLVSVLLWHRADKPVPDDKPVARHVVQSIPQVLELL